MNRSAVAQDKPAAGKPELTREDLVELADRLLDAVCPYTSDTGALVWLPGPEGGYGRRVDGLEGFARTFLLAGFRIAGARGQGVDELLERYARGLSAGTDPNSTEHWIGLAEHGQAKVEAASLALILDLTRPWLWDQLAPAIQDRIVSYLAPAVGDPTYPRINWVWFRIVVETFLRSVGGPWSPDDIAEDLATHDSFLRADGWLADGPQRAFDHYTGWALHLYPTLWARMRGAQDLAADRRERDLRHLDRYLRDAVHLVGGDGSPLIQGRSLIYRFAAAAPFWVGAISQVPSVSPAVLRRAATGIIGHFLAHGVPDDRGLLTIGWHHEWRHLAQSYSGPGSPYWAAKGLLGIALPPEHPVWTAPASALPIECGDQLTEIRAPGWLVSATHADGIVRVLNHGTDHATEGADTADSPLYARLGYSTVTSPLLDEAAWTQPLEQSVCLLDGSGRASHRTGMRLLGTRIDGGVGVAASLAQAHWVTPEAGQADHGSGRQGSTKMAGQVTTVSLVRGPWELRLIRVRDPRDAVGLSVGGWPVSGPTVHTDCTRWMAQASTPALVSRVVLVNVDDERPSRPGADRFDIEAGNHSLLGSEPLGTEWTCGVQLRADASPLGERTGVPWLRLPVPDSWVAVLVDLSGADQSSGAAISLQVSPSGQATITWPDGLRTSTAVPEAALSPPPATAR